MEKIPDTVLSKNKMAALMVDVQLMEAAMNTNIMKTEFSPATPPNTNILKKHGISKKQFDESFEYYAQHPELFAEIYQLVLDDLSKMQAEVMNKK
ncbi:MAG: DUF4296 domain-containing protein [Bacteroidia bacterium]|nr:DUF4296 domain-containing protein [Bacteroidia bacterium]